MFALHYRMIAGEALVPRGTPLWREPDYVSFVEGHTLFNPDSYFQARDMGYVIESPDIIASVTCPVLLLTAKQMMMQPDEFESAVSLFKTHWQAGQHVHFEDSGHFIPFDQFERFLKTILDVL